VRIDVNGVVVQICQAVEAKLNRMRHRPIPGVDVSLAIPGGNIVLGKEFAEH
jgi:hypothetical protein